MALRRPSKLLVSASVFLGLGLTSVVTAQAQTSRPVAPAQTQTRAAAPAPVWTVVPAQSRLGFRAEAAGAAFNGRIDQWTATIRFDPRNLAGSSLAVDINVASIKTGDAQRDAYLPAKDWFDTARHPRARFSSTQIRSLGGNRYEAVGTLRIRGVEQGLTLPFTVDITNNQAKAKGAIALNRNAFGIGQGQWAGEDTVARTVNVSFDILANRRP